MMEISLTGPASMENVSRKWDVLAGMGGFNNKRNAGKQMGHSTVRFQPKRCMSLVVVNHLDVLGVAHMPYFPGYSCLTILARS